MASSGGQPKRRSSFFIAATNIRVAGRKSSSCLHSMTSRFSRGTRAATDVRRANAAPRQNLSAVIKDTDAFVRHISAEHGITLENMIVLAHSVGAVTAAAWVHDYAPPIRAHDSRDRRVSRKTLRPAGDSSSAVETGETLGPG